MDIRFKKRLLQIVDNIVGTFYPRYKPGDYNLAGMKKIIIIRPDRIGDVVLSLPALRELKKKRPDIRLTVLISSYAEDLLTESKIVDSVIILDQNMGLRKWLTFIKILRQQRYDIAIDMVFSRKLLSGVITFLTNSRIKLGFYGGAKQLLFNSLLSPQEGQKYEVERNFELVQSLIGSDGDKSLSSDCLIPDQTYVNTLFKNGVLRDTSHLYIGIHPGAHKNVTNRLWPWGRYAEVADKIISKYDAKVFFTGSKSKEDKQLLESIERKMKNRAIFIKGDNTLRQLFALYQYLDVFISTFTGPLHLAVAAGVSTVVLGGPTPPERWMPRGKKHILVQANLDCVPCRDNIVCSRKDYACMNNIKIEDVLNAVDKIVSKKSK